MELPNGAQSHVARNRLPAGIKPGDPVDVTIAGVEVDQALLSVEPIPQEVAATESTAVRQIAGGQAWRPFVERGQL